MVMVGGFVGSNITLPEDMGQEPKRGSSFPSLVQVAPQSENAGHGGDGAGSLWARCGGCRCRLPLGVATGREAVTPSCDLVQ